VHCHFCQTKTSPAQRSHAAANPALPRHAPTYRAATYLTRPDLSCRAVPPRPIPGTPGPTCRTSASEATPSIAIPAKPHQGTPCAAPPRPAMQFLPNLTRTRLALHCLGTLCDACRASPAKPCRSCLAIPQQATPAHADPAGLDLAATHLVPRCLTVPASARCAIPRKASRFLPCITLAGQACPCRSCRTGPFKP
jgi:hypothetical protein